MGSCGADLIRCALSRSAREDSAISGYRRDDKGRESNLFSPGVLPSVNCSAQNSAYVRAQKE